MSSNFRGNIAYSAESFANRFYCDNHSILKKNQMHSHKKSIVLSSSAENRFVASNACNYTLRDAQALHTCPEQIAFQLHWALHASHFYKTCAHLAWNRSVRPTGIWPLEARMCARALTDKLQRAHITENCVFVFKIIVFRAHFALECLHARNRHWERERAREREPYGLLWLANNYMRDYVWFRCCCGLLLPFIRRLCVVRSTQSDTTNKHNIQP